MKRFALFGDPVGHSKSPRMHSAAYRALGWSHVYEARHVVPDALADAVDAVRRGELEGANVTVPHKERVLAFVDGVDATARVIGAANTLVRTSDGKVIAHNTDAPALVDEFADLGIRSGGNAVHALVLGAGGAARAAMFALARSGIIRTIEVRSRRFSDTHVARAFESELRDATGSVVVRATELAPDVEADRAIAIVVQATSAGLGSHGAGSATDGGRTAVEALAWDALPDTAVVLDVVYADAPTAFVSRARARGLRAEDGRGMLARQAERAFELWFGESAPVGVMRRAIDVT
ncbi:MAG: shikimate dehydrogenase [Polyangiaceae bacterium]